MRDDNIVDPDIMFSYEITPSYSGPFENECLGTIKFSMELTEDDVKYWTDHPLYIQFLGNQKAYIKISNLQDKQAEILIETFG